MQDSKAAPGAKARRRVGDVRTDTVASATRLFAERGFAPVTTRDICEAANVPMSGLYRHFRDKESLYLHCVMSAFNEVGDQVYACLDENLPAPDLLFQIAKGLCEVHLSNTDVPKLILRHMLERDYGMLQRISDQVIFGPSREIVRRIGAWAPGREVEIVHSIYSMSFGFPHMAAMATILGWDLPHLQGAYSMATFILSLVCPHHDWRKVAMRNRELA